MNDEVLSHLDKAIYTITLNRPTKHNCMDWSLLRSLNEHVLTIERDPSVDVVVLRGAGDRSFSTGADLKEFKSLTNQGLADWIRFGNEAFNRLESLPKPTIAVVQGYAYGGGLELALACDFILATQDATFCSPELRHGWIPGWGGLTRLRRQIGERAAKEMVFLAEPIGADAAFRLGLVNQVCDPASLENELVRWCKKLSELDKEAFTLAKSVLGDQSRRTDGVDLQFDVLATRLAREGRKE